MLTIMLLNMIKTYSSNQINNQAARWFTNNQTSSNTATVKSNNKQMVM